MLQGMSIWGKNRKKLISKGCFLLPGRPALTSPFNLIQYCYTFNMETECKYIHELFLFSIVGLFIPLYVTGVTELPFQKAREWSTLNKLFYNLRDTFKVQHSLGSWNAFPLMPSLLTRNWEKHIKGWAIWKTCSIHGISMKIVSSPCKRVPGDKPAFSM